MNATRIQRGQFITIVGYVDVQTGDGKILYVNPTEVKLAPADDVPNSDFALVVRDAAGAELQRVHPILRMPASDPSGMGGGPRSRALLQEALPRMPGMASVSLLHKGVEKDVFLPGHAPVRTSAGAGMLLPGPVAPGQNRMSFDASAFQTEPGVTYTVLVKPENASHWSTIAVGRQTPAVEIDRNQFPGETRAKVKILRSTGFEHTVVLEDEIKLEDKK
jgi:hypothetical protein